jgi:hypothetical protein
MTERSWVQTLYCGAPCTIHMDQSMEAKIDWKITWHCCICCNPSKGRVDFEDGWLIKSSFTTNEQTPTKNNKNNNNI